MDSRSSIHPPIESKYQRGSQPSIVVTQASQTSTVDPQPESQSDVLPLKTESQQRSERYQPSQTTAPMRGDSRPVCHVPVSSVYAYAAPAVYPSVPIYPGTVIYQSGSLAQPTSRPVSVPQATCVPQTAAASCIPRLVEPQCRSPPLYPVGSRPTVQPPPLSIPPQEPVSSQQPAVVYQQACAFPSCQQQYDPFPRFCWPSSFPFSLLSDLFNPPPPLPLSQQIRVPQTSSPVYVTAPGFGVSLMQVAVPQPHSTASLENARNSQNAGALSGNTAANEKGQIKEKQQKEVNKSEQMSNGSNVRDVQVYPRIPVQECAQGSGRTGSPAQEGVREARPVHASEPGPTMVRMPERHANGNGHVARI